MKLFIIFTFKRKLNQPSSLLIEFKSSFNLDSDRPAMAHLKFSILNFFTNSLTTYCPVNPIVEKS